MEKATHTTEEFEELRKQMDELKKQEASRAQQLQAQVQQVQQQLQNVTGAAINTMGQIEQLRAVLDEQKRERYQLEGVLRAMMAEQKR